MATTVPEIRVFAMFPLDLTNSEPSSWNWVHCLTLPLATFNTLQFIRKPYKWIRYATGVVVGAQGDLSISRDSPHNVMDYNQDLQSESADLYYHTSDAEKQKMLPADPDMGRTTVTANSDATSRRVQFRSDVVERDSVCVLTGFKERYCDAAHLMPHSKAIRYANTYTQRRNRDPAGNDIVYRIDDVRNGILLNPIAHSSFGKNIAFLMTPNFAMTTADVNPTAPPTEKRCTTHLFVPDEPEAFGDRTLRSGYQVQMPDIADEWPPNVLFDAVYVNAVLHHFAPQTMRDTLERCRSTFYPKTERRNEQNQAREQRAANRASRAGDDRIDYFDCLMMLPYIMVPPDKQEAIWRKAAEERAEREQSRLEDKVVGWAKEVAYACP
ncbi:hypothetical protein OG21DRAFT_1410629 [Imleria badia]|nr:hypothetical protein OG21DRAFT_1410629 [Imleria badia]